MTVVRRWTRTEAEQAAARALWEAGNDRIGFREWDTVKDHYLLEAGMALDALGLTADFGRRRTVRVRRRATCGPR